MDSFAVSNSMIVDLRIVHVNVAFSSATVSLGETVRTLPEYEARPQIGTPDGRDVPVLTELSAHKLPVGVRVQHVGELERVVGEALGTEAVWNDGMCRFGLSSEKPTIHS